ncbi:MAG: vanadium-dependent haloperoxidase [Patulibacter minatonensis]
MNHPPHPRASALRRSATLAAVAAGLTLVPSAAASPDNTTIPRATPTNLETVLAWYDTTNAAVGTWASAGNTQVTASRTWATAWSAADEAITEFSKVRGKRAKGDAGARRIALARAVHDVLITFVPAIKDRADQQLFLTQQSAGGGEGVKLADQLARKAAERWVASRAFDGLDVDAVNVPFTPPAAAPGVWQPTLPAFGGAVQAGQGKGRPFVDPQVAKQVAPEPPAIDSEQVIADLTEIDRLGGTSPSQTANRGANRTRIARFWSQSSVGAFTTILRQIVLGEGLSLSAQVHLLSVFHRVTTDVQIATYASKYKYLRWRPVTALRTDDGNPNTPYDPTFTPLINTPAHPEYPSGHVAYATAAERVFKALIRPIPEGAINVTSPVLPGTVISYLNWDTITDDNVNARVWSGIHLRSTDNITRTWATKLAKQELRELGENASSKTLAP